MCTKTPLSVLLMAFSLCVIKKNRTLVHFIEFTYNPKLCKKHTQLCVSPFVGILGFDGIFVVCVKKIPNSGAFHRLYIQSKIVEKTQ